jgi:hypothetical protein
VRPELAAAEIQEIDAFPEHRHQEAADARRSRARTVGLRAAAQEGERDDRDPGEFPQRADDDLLSSLWTIPATGTTDFFSNS